MNRKKKQLIIVESPTKMTTLKKLLPKGFDFQSSIGHICDLPPRKFGIDIKQDFTPEYIVLPGKEDVVKKIQTAAKKADEVLLSPDPDREGEAIAWHIASLLPKGTPYKRVTFHEFTKSAVENALNDPKDINQDLVDAQQARRLLDRMVGYKISPILHRRIFRGKRDGFLSAGRVQSVALKLVVDREKQIDAFKPVEYWVLGSLFKKSKKTITATLYSVDGLRVEKEKPRTKKVFLIPDEKTAKKIETRLKKATYTVKKLEKKERKRNPVPPFTTSSLQQEAYRHFGYNAQQTMSIAQTLYEGRNLGKEGFEGLITYMRTDSFRVAKEAQLGAKKFIKDTYGPEFLPPKPPVYKSKKSAQEAHEAIRPTNIGHPPESIKQHLSPEQFKLYQLIWQRFIASQMNPAIYDTVTCDIETNDDLLLRATGSVIKFQGFLAVYQEKEDYEEEAGKEGSLLPPLEVGEKLPLDKTFANQSFTKPPPRFTEASLVKEMERLGIGRPSTYASIMQKIVSKQYTTKTKSTLQPTELGKVICEMLENHFGLIMDIDFTAHMEDDLDKIADADIEWKKYIAKFWKSFEPVVDTAEKEAFVPKIDTDLKCPKCGKMVQKIWAKDRYFYGCSDYPDCDYTSPIEELTYDKADYAEDFDWDQPCPKCGAEMKVRQSRYGIFLGCTKYPKCQGIVNIPKKGEEPVKDLPPCPAIGCDGQILQRRSRFGKLFFSCSNYPDCDVIANSLDELQTKYTNHQKTAYEKKGKGKGRMGQYKTSDALKAIIGEEKVTRGDATKKIWEYIKKHKLQDPENRRSIVPDKKMAAFLGHSNPIDMMQLASYLSSNLSR